MNEYDAAKIADILAVSHGFTLASEPNAADFIILNTCAVRAKAVEKIFSELGRLRLLKKKKPKLILAVGGCVSMQEQANIFRRAPYVDIVFGPQTIQRLPDMYNKILANEKRIIDISFSQNEKFDYLPKSTKNSPVAYVSIMEGCNKFCSYCIVPYTRGRELSRKTSDILDEIKILCDNGAKEIHLLGQNVNAYRDPQSNTTLANLIDQIAKIKAIQRIRFTTSHPAEFSDDLLEIFSDEPKLVNHIHLPIQSGSNRILKLMRRGYTTADYQTIVDKLRKIRPNISISTDIIVGFPGETAEDFLDTMRIIQEVNFDSSFSFIYSPRPGTPAAKMADNVEPAVKKQRLLILQNQLATQARRYSKEMVNTKQKILVTNTSKKNPAQFSGRTENNRVVNFIASKNLIGKIVTIKITQALPNSLRGELV